MVRRIAILGATGSIGRSTLEVLAHTGGRERWRVTALTGASNVALLAEQAVATGAGVAVTSDPARYAELRERLAGTGVEAAAGPEAVVSAASGADCVMAAIVGAAGLAPTLAAARSGATVALANKECLVSGGAFFLGEIEKGGARLVPVDSEHSAIFQALDRHAAPERVILTASGGPFRDWPLERMAAATVAEAVAHPNWSMGAKISIDSASMFNKGLEMIEAKWLFDLRPEQVEVVVHPQSVVHSMVGYADGALLAQMGPPDMRQPIAYALSCPERATLPLRRLDFAALGRLDFMAPDPERFPALRLARAALEAGGSAGCAFNAAKETALDAFIAGRLRFLEMARVVDETMEALSPCPAAGSLGEVLDLDARARAIAEARVAAL